MKNIIAYAKRNQRGAILITLIVAIVIIGLSGIAMLHFSTTSSYGELIANRQQRAYYIGEAGANHAQQIFSMNKVTNGPFPSPTEFTLGNDKFIVHTFDKPTDATHLIIKSTGIVGSGWLTTRQLITRDIVKETAVPPGMPPIITDPSGVPIGFDTDSNTKLDTAWTLTPSTDTKDVEIYDGSLMFENTKDGSIVLNKNVVNLCDAWVNNGYLSSYFLQVKITNASSNPKYFIHGLSFRVQDDAALSSYGISFYRHNGTNCNDPWCAETVGIRDNISLTKDGKIYVVLWKKVNGTYAVLASAWMDATYGVVAADGDLKDWSTLVIRVNERSDGNHIKAYIQSEPAYPRGTVYWNVSSFKLVTWTWPSTKTEVIDNTFPSAGLCTCTAEGTCTANRPKFFRFRTSKWESSPSLFLL